MILIDNIEKYSTKRNIIIGFFVVLFISVIVFPSFPKLFNDNKVNDVLDLKFGFTIDTVHNSLSNMKVNGRTAYFFSTIIIDIPYAIIYGFVSSLIIIFFLNKLEIHKAYKLLVFMPLLTSLFDLIENFGIINFIVEFPVIESSFVYYISLSNNLKWICALITFMIVLIIIIKYLKHLRKLKAT